MKKASTILWIIYFVILALVFALSSCSSTKPRYKAPPDNIAHHPPADLGKKQENQFKVTVWSAIMIGVVLHFTHEDK